MKKFLKGFVLFLIILVSGYFAYTYFQNKASYIGVIHENANSALKIAIHDIKETLILDALTSPRYYYNDEESAEQKQGNGIEIGHNVFCYSLAEIPNTYFTTLNISDTNAFQIFIENKLAKKNIFIQEAEKEEYQFAFLNTMKMAVAWNDKKIVLAVSLRPTDEKLTEVFTDILVKDKTIKESEHSLLQALKGESSHIIYSNGHDVATIDFTDNEAKLNGKIFSNTIVTSLTKSEVAFIPNTSLSFQLDSNFKRFFVKDNWLEKLDKTTFFSKSNIEASKIAAHTTGFLSFEIRGKTIQKDTIITYDYDENFEKVEQKSIQENEVPKMVLKLGAEKQNLRQYFIEAKAIDENNVFIPLPFYKWYVSENDSCTSFSTFKEEVETKQRSSYAIFDANVNFEKLQQDVGLNQTRQLFKLLDNLNIEMFHFDKNQFNIAGGLKGKNPEINILSQLYFGLEIVKDSTQREAEL